MMSWTSLAAILVSVLLNASAMILLKAGARVLGVISLSTNWFQTIFKMATQPFLIAGVCCYGVSLVVWVFVISREAVSSAYPMTALVYVINALAAGYFFNEMLRPAQWVGMALILMGVVLMARA